MRRLCKCAKFDIFWLWLLHCRFHRPPNAARAPGEDPAHRRAGNANSYPLLKILAVAAVLSRVLGEELFERPPPETSPAFHMPRPRRRSSAGSARCPALPAVELNIFFS